MAVNISTSNRIACLCEGGAETVIMEKLLDHDLLVFSREQLIDERVLPRTSAKKFAQRYLKVDYGGKITILRIIDSRSEKFILGKVFKCQVEVINVITAPEIEILVIVSQGKYNEYSRSGEKKPSDYCKNVLRIPNVKSPAFVSDYFSDPSFLVNSIREYHRLHKQKNNEASLFDLIKSDLK